jgi:hypothetical protein
MDGKQFIKLNAEEILKCLLSHDQEIVRAYFEQEKRDCYEAGKKGVEVGAFLWGAVVVGACIFVAILIGFSIQDSKKTMEVQRDCEQIRSTCIERVLCTCKDLPVEEP